MSDHYKPGTNHLLLIECKSYLDSLGVKWEAFDQPKSAYAERFKLFHNKALFDAVKKQILNQLTKEGMLVGKSTAVNLGLVAGKIYGADEIRLREFFAKRKWILISPSELAKRLRDFADRGYDNDVATIVV